MKRRMLDGGIWANDKFARLPYPARLLQMGLINLADDQGRIIAHPSYLRSQVFPYDEEVSGSDIRTWLAAIVKNGTVIAYEVEGREYIQLVNWWDYQSLQYAAPSEHPRPEGWQDRIRYNAKGGMTLTCNWVTPKGETPEDTCDQAGNPLPMSDSLPRRNPGGRPPQNPPGNTNKEEIKSKSNTRAPAQEELPKTPQPNARTRQDFTAEQSARAMNREYTGINPKLLTKLTNHVKRIYGYSALIDKPGSDSLEDELRSVAYELWKLGFNSDDDMLDLKASWEKYATHFTNKRPGKDQLYKLAITMISSTPASTENGVLDYSIEELV